MFDFLHTLYIKSIIHYTIYYKMISWVFLILCPLHFDRKAQLLRLSQNHYFILCFLNPKICFKLLYRCINNAWFFFFPQDNGNSELLGHSTFYKTVKWVDWVMVSVKFLYEEIRWMDKFFGKMITFITNNVGLLNFGR